MNLLPDSLILLTVGGALECSHDLVPWEAPYNIFFLVRSLTLTYLLKGLSLPAGSALFNLPLSPVDPFYHLLFVLTLSTCVMLSLLQICLLVEIKLWSRI